MKKTILLLGFAAICLKSNAQWELTGNAGTNPATNFVGTTDSQPLIFKTNGILSGQITPAVSSNFFMGYRAGLGSGGTSTGNCFVGTEAGVNHSGGLWNSFFGVNAGASNGNGSENAFFGAGAGSSNTFSRNAYFGYSAGTTNSTGTLNSFFGYGSGLLSKTGNNSYFGARAGYGNAFGTFNCVFGADAGTSNSDADSLSMFGYKAGFVNTADGNMFFGFESGVQNTTGKGNTFFGTTTGRNNVTGMENSFFGREAGFSTTAGSNAFFGAFSGRSNTGGTENTFVGHSSGRNNTNGFANVMVGFSAGANSSGSHNTFVGWSAGLASTTGTQNTFIGRAAGSALTTGIGNLAIGYQASVGTSRNNGIAIGPGTNVTLDNCAVIGNSLINKLGIGKTPAAANILEFQATTAKLTTGGVWTNASDRRIKDNIIRLDKKEILSKIETLDISRWHYKADAEPVTHIGPMSQDFYAAFQTGDETTISTIDPSGVALIGIQQLSEENKVLRKENEELKARLDRIEAILANNTSCFTPTQKVTPGLETKQANLGQNFPNPSTGKTIVTFFIPADVKTAEIEISTSTGVKLSLETIIHRGHGSLELDLRKLPNGTYFYSLFTDGHKAETRQLLLTQ